VQRRWPELFEKHFIQRVGHIGMETVDEVVQNFSRRGFKILHIEKPPAFFEEVGVLSAQFNYDDFNRVMPLWMAACVKTDAAISRSIWVKEILNILLRPLTALECVATSVQKRLRSCLPRKRLSRNRFMAIDINGVQMLLSAHKKGVAFEKVLMFGRQNVNVFPGTLAEMLRARGLAHEEVAALSSHDPDDIYAEPLFRALGREKSFLWMRRSTRDLPSNTT